MATPTHILIQIAALVRKEFLALVKDPANRMILFAPVLVQSLLFGYGATYDLLNVPYAVLDQSHSKPSAELLARLDGTRLFRRAATLSSSRQIAEVIDSGKVLMVFSIPPDFETLLTTDQNAPVQMILDGRNSTTAGVAAAHVGAIVADYNASLHSTSPGIVIERRSWFNPNIESRWTMMSGLVAALSMLQTLLIAALSVAREREHGTFDQLLVTPLTPTGILIGKAVPAVVIGLIQSLLIFLITRFWFGIPVQGSMGMLLFGLLTFTVTVVGVGLSISALSLTMQQAMLYAFLLIIPLMLLSGLLTPIDNMPDILQTITYANPLRFGINIVRRVYLEGAALGDIATEFIPLLVIAAITLPLAAWLFRHRLS